MGDLLSPEKTLPESPQETGTTAATETTPSFEVPEKFRDKPPEEIVKSYLELEKEKSRLGSAYGDLNRKHALLEADYQARLRGINGTPNNVEPSQATDKGFDLKKINEIYWENPGEATYQVAKRVIEEMNQQQQNRAVQDQQLNAERYNAIERAELAMIQQEDPTFDEERYKLMHHVMRNEPQVVAGLTDPSQILRALNDRAKTLQATLVEQKLRQIGIDPQVLRSYQTATKEVAQQGLPSSARGSSGSAPGTGKQLSEDEKYWLRRLGVKDIQ